MTDVPRIRPFSRRRELHGHIERFHGATSRLARRPLGAQRSRPGRLRLVVARGSSWYFYRPDLIRIRSLRPPVVVAPPVVLLRCRLPRLASAAVLVLLRFGRRLLSLACQPAPVDGALCPRLGG